jgi:hypothetical protein
MRWSIKKYITEGILGAKGKEAEESTKKDETQDARPRKRYEKC